MKNILLILSALFFVSCASTRECSQREYSSHQERIYLDIQEDARDARVHDFHERLHERQQSRY